jgi:hypothetical protein
MKIDGSGFTILKTKSSRGERRKQIQNVAMFSNITTYNLVYITNFFGGTYCVRRQVQYVPLKSKVEIFSLKHR